MNRTYQACSGKGDMVVFFDFDGTLTTKDTLMPFLKFVVGARIYYIKLLLISPVLVAYLLGLMRNDMAKQVLLWFYLSGYRDSTLYKCGDRFVEQIIPTLLRPKGMERLRRHQQQGHQCVLVSASLDFYLQPWVKHQGLDGLLCSRLRVKDGKVSGLLDGSNCYGDSKRERIQEWLDTRKFDAIYAYGDTKGDYPMLRLADQPFYWNGHDFELKSFSSWS